MTVGAGVSPALLDPFLRKALVGSWGQAPNTTGGEFHPALRTGIVVTRIAQNGKGLFDCPLRIAGRFLLNARR